MELSQYQNTIHKTRYARWDDEHKRREHYPETVERYINFLTSYMDERYQYAVSDRMRHKLFEAVVEMDVMPSMRAFMTSGPALLSAEVANYNCSYLPVDHVRAFSEHMYVLMCGAGSGFSVERRNTNKLPEVPENFTHVEDTVVVADSRKGWCTAYHQFITLLYKGQVPDWDTSRVRKEGERLKTFGGYASGPKVLEELFEFTIEVFRNARGRKLKPIEVFSLMCYIAQIVVVGGVRRSATIALFDKDDFEMRRAKSGLWWEQNPHFAMANISAVFESKPDAMEFSEIWLDLIKSGSGEPGFLNREALWKQCERIGRPVYDEKGERILYGVNPCSEIILPPYSFCNLTGAVIRPDDTIDVLREKVRLASILGTFQSCVDDFKFLRKVWRENVQEERLLGVCLAGIMDHPMLSTANPTAAAWLQELRDVAIETNKRYAKSIGINESASVTAVKPAGNSGELFNCSSGIHPRQSQYYLRSIRQSRSDPLTQFLIDQGFHHEVSVQNERDMVFYFPVESPKHARLASDMTALEQLEHWLMVKENFATHTVSCTIYVRKNEWVEVGAWVYKHFDQITGLSFLPYDDHKYEQAPLTPITKDEYDAWVARMPEAVDWDLIAKYESTDTTSVSQEFTCTGDKCTL